MCRCTDGNLIEGLQYATTTPNIHIFALSTMLSIFIIKLAAIYQCIISLLSTLSKFLTFNSIVLFLKTGNLTKPNLNVLTSLIYYHPHHLLKLNIKIIFIKILGHDGINKPDISNKN